MLIVPVEQVPTANLNGPDVAVKLLVGQLSKHLKNLHETAVTPKP